MCDLRKRQVLVSRSFFTTFTARAQKATRSSPRRSLPMPRNALGRGLGALIREPEPKTSSEPAPIQPHVTTANGAASAPAREAAHPGPQQIDIDLIEPSPFQPRTRFREEALEELARSIQARDHSTTRCPANRLPIPIDCRRAPMARSAKGQPHE